MIFIFVRTEVLNGFERIFHVILFVVVYHRNITAVEDQKEIVAYCVLTGFDMNPPPMVHEWYFQNKVRFNHGSNQLQEKQTFLCFIT